MTNRKTLPKFAPGGCIPAPAPPWWTPVSGWLHLDPDESVVDSSGVVLNAWEFHLIRALAVGSSDPRYPALPERKPRDDR